MVVNSVSEDQDVILKNVVCKNSQHVEDICMVAWVVDGVLLVIHFQVDTQQTVHKHIYGVLIEIKA